MNILDKILNKRGIKDTSELSPSEKTDFDRWERILSEGDMSVDKIRQFCQSQINIIENSFRNIENTTQKNERLIIQHNIYKTLLNTITSPQAERESLEKYLNTLI